jgi:hypothetical protein
MLRHIRSEFSHHKRKDLYIASLSPIRYMGEPSHKSDSTIDFLINNFHTVKGFNPADPLLCFLTDVCTEAIQVTTDPRLLSLFKDKFGVDLTDPQGMRAYQKALEKQARYYLGRPPKYDSEQAQHGV